MVLVCPTGTHLCAPNGRQSKVFCDVDRDCYGDLDYCSGDACPAKKGCCIHEPFMANKPAGWLPPMAGDPQLSPEVCERLFRDPGHQFRRMWGAWSRTQNHDAGGGCWNFDRWQPWEKQSAAQFFEDIFSGRYCELTDWYEGSNVAHGWFSEPDAPALLGFDADIIGYCHNNCDGESVNILAIFGGLEYNSCRNFEWQMCAIRGMLSSQSSKEIVFARAPKTVAMDGWPPFGQCSGFTNSGCNTWDGFANDDIFYLEVCLFSQVCANSEQLFQIDVGERFVCDFSADGFEQLQAWLLDGPDMSLL